MTAIYAHPTLLHSLRAQQRVYRETGLCVIITYEHRPGKKARPVAVLEGCSHPLHKHSPAANHRPSGDLPPCA